ncbi:MAG: hypothetical protein HY763_06395 [Planctomycetes bacterium]|nr:hypothetical protein [Planctomycetota bacterium]
MRCISTKRYGVVLIALGVTLGVSVRPAVPQTLIFSVDPASPTPLCGDAFVAGPQLVVPAVQFGLLPAGDNVDALSGGNDLFDDNTPLLFSVDRVTIGAPGTPINADAAPEMHDAHGTIYETRPPNSHAPVVTGLTLGLAPGFFGDDVDAVGEPVFFSIDRTSVTSLVRGADFAGHVLVTDGTNLSVWAAGFQMGLQPGDDIDALLLLNVKNSEMDAGGDVALFSLDPFSPSTTTGGQGGQVSPADVLMTRFDGTFHVYRHASQLGLQSDDNVDALHVLAGAIPTASGWGLVILALTLLTGAKVFFARRTVTTTSAS